MSLKFVPPSVSSEVESVVHSYWSKVFGLFTCKHCGSIVEPLTVEIYLRPSLDQSLERLRTGVKIISMYATWTRNPCNPLRLCGCGLRKTGYTKIVSRTSRWITKFRREIIGAIKIPQPSYLPDVLPAVYEGRWYMKVRPPNSHQLLMTVFNSKEKRRKCPKTTTAKS